MDMGNKAEIAEPLIRPAYLEILACTFTTAWLARPEVDGKISFGILKHGRCKKQWSFVEWKH